MKRLRQYFSRLAIRTKVRLVALSISMLVVLITAGTLIFMEMRSFRKEMVAEMNVYANVLSRSLEKTGSQSDAAMMAQILSSVAGKRHMLEAHVLDREGNAIASYFRDALPEKGTVDHFETSQEASFSRNTLEVVRGLHQGDDVIGFVYLKSDLNVLYDRLGRYFQSAALVLLLVAALAMILANVFQHVLLGPVLRLSSAAKHIALTKRYDMRVPSAGSDELGVLVETFNDMVAQTQQQTAELSLANSVQQKLISDLSAAKESVEKAHEAKSQFLARISHEIRTPVNGVMGMVDLLLDSPLQDQQKRLANTVRASAQTLLDILNELLDYAKIEASRIELEIVEYDVRHMADGIVQILSQTAFGKNIEIGCAVDARLPRMLMGDPLRLRQILINLVGNAVKFTSQGEVALDIRVEANQNLTYTLTFEVTDTGVGIPLEAQRKIFDAFAQADEGTSRKFGGTGLGLSIAKQLVDLMGGDLFVQSQAGKGSRFWFTIVQNAAEEQPPPPELPAACKGQVLIVDHSPIATRSLQQRLGQFGLRYATVASGSGALEMVEGQMSIGMPFQSVIVSSRLTDMDTATFLEKLRRLSQDVAIVINAPICDQARIEQVGKQHGIAILDKPSDLETLAVALAHTPGASGEYDVMQQPVRTATTGASMNTAASAVVATTQPLVSAADEKPADTATMVKGHILVAEDNPVNAEITRSMLTSRMYMVTVADDGMEAYNAVRASIDYDLILMDGQMPNMDGLESAIAIRAYEHENGRTPIPIIACTANIVDGLKELYLAEGMNDFISKPFSRDQLIRMVEKWHTPRAIEEAAPLATGNPDDARERNREDKSVPVAVPEVPADEDALPDDAQDKQPHIIDDTQAPVESKEDAVIAAVAQTSSESTVEALPPVAANTLEEKHASLAAVEAREQQDAKASTDQDSHPVLPKYAAKNTHSAIQVSEPLTVSGSSKAAQTEPTVVEQSPVREDDESTFSDDENSVQRKDATMIPFSPASRRRKKLSVTGVGAQKSTVTVNTAATVESAATSNTAVAATGSMVIGVPANDRVNVSVLKNIAQMDPDNGAEFLESLINIYLKDSQDILQQMHMAVGRLDFDSLQKLAHKIKSSSANIGAMELSKFAKDIEANPASSDIDKRLQQLRNEYNGVQQTLATINVSAL